MDDSVKTMTPISGELLHRLVEDGELAEAGDVENIASELCQARARLGATMAAKVDDVSSRYKNNPVAVVLLIPRAEYERAAGGLKAGKTYHVTFEEKT